MNSNTYQGRPCKRGHVGIRYKSNSECLDCLKLRMQNYYPKWYAVNSDKVIKRTKQSRIGKSRAAEAASRRARQKQAQPYWLGVEHLSKIREIYRTCPIGWEVDHIIPLNGKEVCGLHVPWNLQHLPSQENLKKGNRLLPLHQTQGSEPSYPLC